VGLRLCLSDRVGLRLCLSDRVGLRLCLSDRVGLRLCLSDRVGLCWNFNFFKYNGLKNSILFFISSFPQPQRPAVHQQMNINARSALTITQEAFSFTPAFVHQIFDKELLWGYSLLPSQTFIISAVEESDSDDDNVIDNYDGSKNSRAENSSQYDDELDFNRKGVTIAVTLSPCCSSASVVTSEVDLSDSETETETEIRPAQKKVKFSPEVIAMQIKQLAREQAISSKLIPSLPPLNLNLPLTSIITPSFLLSLGEELNNSNSNSDSIKLIHSKPSKNPTSANYFQKVEPLSLFLIETASKVDTTNDKDGGRWEIIFIFELSSSSFVGYVTLYFFNAPFRKPKPGVVVRICQMIVMPKYQRRGHGQTLVNAVYELARKSDEIVEITVEDPCSGFTSLRNLVDYIDVSRELAKCDGFADRGNYEVLAESTARKIAQRLKIIDKQVVICHELLKFDEVKDCVDLVGGEDCKAYRLMVKRRLNKVHQEDLEGFGGDKEKKKLFLATSYLEVVSDYKSLSRRVHV